MEGFIPKEKQELIYLKWQDAHSCSGGWLSEKELKEKIEEEAFICENVGWVVYEDDREIHLVSRRSTWEKDETGDSEYGQYQRIPKTWVIDRQTGKLT